MSGCSLAHCRWGQSSELLWALRLYWAFGVDWSIRCVRIHNQTIIRKISFVVKLPTSNPSEPAPPELEAPSPVPEIPECIRLDRVDRQIALVLAAVSFALYLRTTAPDMLGGDTGEFQFAA